MWIVVLRLVPRLLIITALLCSAVPALSKRAPVDDPAWRALGFDACTLPCWAGIMPGETSFDEAYDLLMQHVSVLDTRLLMSGSQINFSASLADQYANGLLFYSQGQVGNIRLNVQLPLIQFIERLGAPYCFVYSQGPYGTSGSVTVYWESDGVLIAALVPPSGADVQPTTTIQALALNPNEHACEQEETLPWLGFAPRWRYEQAEERRS